MGPLHGVRIVELAGIGPGPFACMLLADMGADIVRIERIGGPPPDRRHDILLRGRAVLKVDLKRSEGRDLVLDLVARADALVEGFRPGVTERLGLGPGPCLHRNPRLVYGRMTGWGQDGPLHAAAGHDINYVALSGALDAIGEPGRKPVVPLNLVGDFGGGALYLALGVVSALLEARSSGHGQVVDAAIVDGAASLMAMMYGKHAAGQWTADRGDNLLDGGAPWYDTYRTADGGYVALGAIEPQFFALLAARLELPADWLQRRHDKAAWPELRDQLASRFLARTRDDWCRLLEGTDICFAPVLSMAEAPDHPHNRARAAFVEIDGVIHPAPAPRFSRTPTAIRPAAGLSADWGVDPARMQALHDSRVVADAH